jgi:branched-chain amino acid transport system substrate-binding protein
MMRTIRSATTAVLVALAISSLGPSGVRAAVEPDPLEINAILPLTGAGAFIGKQEAATLGVVEAMTNKTGGVRGRRVKFVIQDDQSNPTVDVQLANAVMAKRVSVIVGPSLTGSCSAVAPLLKSGPVLYCLSPGFHGQPGSFAFNANASTVDTILTLLRYYHGKKLDRVALLTSTDASGQDGERSVTTLVASNPTLQGMSIVANEHFASADVTVSAQMAKLKAANPDALVIWTTGPALGTALRGASEAGLNVPVGISQSNAFSDQLKSYAGFMPPQLLISSEANLSPNPPVGKDFKNAITSYYNAFRATGIEPEVSYSLAWDASRIVLDAFKKYGPDATADQIKSYIEGLRGWTGADGSYDFSGGSRNGLDSTAMMVFRWEPVKATFTPVSKPGGVI